MPNARTIPEEGSPGVACFPKGDHVVVSADGVFVPGSIFGQRSDLGYRIQAGQHGPEVVVFLQGSSVQQEGPSRPEGNHESERRWLSAHRSTHTGQWVALSGDRLLASGCNAAEVYGKAQSMGVPVPFVAYIDPDEEVPFAGW